MHRLRSIVLETAIVWGGGESRSVHGVRLALWVRGAVCRGLLNPMVKQPCYQLKVSPFLLASRAMCQRSSLTLPLDKTFPTLKSNPSSGALNSKRQFSEMLQPRRTSKSSDTLVTVHMHPSPFSGYQRSQK